MLHVQCFLLYVSSPFYVYFLLLPPNRIWSTIVQGHLQPVKVNRIVTSPLINHLNRRRWPLVCKCLQSHCMIQPQARSVQCL